MMVVALSDDVCHDCVLPLLHVHHQSTFCETLLLKELFHKGMCVCVCVCGMCDSYFRVMYGFYRGEHKFIIKTVLVFLNSVWITVLTTTTDTHAHTHTQRRKKGKM